MSKPKSAYRKTTKHPVVARDEVLSSRKGWGQLASFYYEFRRENGRFSREDRARISEASCMETLLSGLDLRGRRVLDAGCGFGYYAFMAAQFGAHVVAVDFSREMIEKGRELLAKSRLSVDFRIGDVRNLSMFDDLSFDVVISGMDMEVPDVRVPIAEFARVLTPHGLLLFSVTHPVVNHGQWQKVQGRRKHSFRFDNYFHRGAYVARWRDILGRQVRFKRFRRPLQDYTEALALNHFVIERLLECEPHKKFKTSDPELYSDVYRVPTYLVVLARKNT